MTTAQLKIDFDQYDGRVNKIPQIEDYFMALACYSSSQSQDNKKVGAVITNKKNQFVSLGWNHMNSEFKCLLSDQSKKSAFKEFKDMEKSNDADKAFNALNFKYNYVTYAVMHAIANANTRDLQDCTLYTTLFPWNECGKLIVQSGIRKVVYYSDIKKESDFVASKFMLDLSGVELVKFNIEKFKKNPLFSPELLKGEGKSESEWNVSFTNPSSVSLEDYFLTDAKRMKKTIDSHPGEKLKFEPFNLNTYEETIKSFYFNNLPKKNISSGPDCDEEFYMNVAYLSKMNSPDPDFRVGACIVKDGKVVSIGYNSHPRYTSNRILSWKKEDDGINSKHMYVCHAELNAVFNTTANMRDATIYVTLFPCRECAKLLISMGILKVVYYEDSKLDISFKASKILLYMAGVEVKKFTKTLKNIDEFARIAFCLNADI